MLPAPGSAVDPATPEAGGVPAGLVYSSDTELGITRVRRGKNFAYRDCKSRWIRAEQELAPIRAARRMSILPCSISEPGSHPPWTNAPPRP
jgi:hypothetical protein